MGEKSGATRTRTPGKAAGTPTSSTTTPALSRKPSSSSTTGRQQQKSILGFFSKASKDKEMTTTTATPTPKIPSSPCLRETTKSNSLQLNKRPSKSITPVPSSDAMEPSSSQENIDSATTVKVPKNCHSLPSPVTPADIMIKQVVSSKPTVMGSSPSRKVSSELAIIDALSLSLAISSYTNLSPMLQVKKAVNYAESSDDDDEDVFVAMKAAKSRRRNRPQSRVADDDDDDDGDVYEESKEPEVAGEDGRFMELVVLVEYITCID